MLLELVLNESLIHLFNVNLLLQSELIGIQLQVFEFAANFWRLFHYFGLISYFNRWIGETHGPFEAIDPSIRRDLTL